MRGMLAVLGWWLAVVGAFGASPASAAPDTSPLATCVARVGASLPDAAAALSHPAAFRCGGRQQRFGPGDYWVRVRDLPATAGVALDRVRYGSLWQARTTLYARYADGVVVALPVVPGRESALIRFNALIEQRLPHRGVAVRDLVWRVDGSANVRGILSSPVIASADASDAANLREALLYAGAWGLCIGLLAYNLALWVAMRQRFVMAYCVMVATLLSYAVTVSGALLWIIPTLANNDRLRLSYVLLAASGAATIWFARTFFEPRVFAGPLGRVARATCVSLLATAVLYAGLAPRAMYVLDRLHGLAFGAQLALTVPILWTARARRSSFTWPFLLAWSGSATMAAIRFSNTFNLLPQPIPLGRNVLLLMTAEVLLSSLAIAYRIHLLGRERDAARAEEIAARLLADTDPLTGLMNRRSFLAQAIGRLGAQLLLIADLDHFKAINDTIGHDGGDEVLRGVARALAAATPPGTLVARIGGEEFAIVADANAGLSARMVVDALRGVRMPFDLTVTASIGACTGPLATEADWKRLYRQADRALYAAKEAGRDRVRDAGMLPLAA